MKRLPFKRPNEHYDERASQIDEQICALLNQRRVATNKNPGFPPLEYISKWARAYDLLDDFLYAVFGVLENEEQFRPVVEPTGFRKHVQVLKAIEREQYIYSVTSIRQYTNASVVNLSIDWDPTSDGPGERPQHHFLKLDIGAQYHCRMDRGSGSTGHSSFNFVVTPPLPDDISGLDFVFTAKDNSSVEIVIHAD
ncbi:hypothetical protein [Paenibacillus beijingensis]|uniref:Uncharacterized protein n=1 Tax=Paenibacillus beijingensis TaxID=1126833 RepID=A0A0D5NKA6_9BACL|nr:hypothetical protein [Paenibacillus beijingensis]AJY75779.1 hypothetical protein VN24_16020 [Paenibacillus beijingensis]